LQKNQYSITTWNNWFD